jgi:hypothetical protein
MPVIIDGTKYQSFKHPMLEYIFFRKNPTKNTDLNVIPFTLEDISTAYRALDIKEPASISNTILDLVRKKRHISSRLPKSVYSLGYDLVKKTGVASDGKSFAGEFIFVGIGNEINSWLEWPDKFNSEIEISSKEIPAGILEFIRSDEGALFSVIDYCDIFSKIFYNKPNTVIRVQNPLKWQPNEIDGFYFSNENDHIQLFPVEAKALTTGDDINLEQIQGALITIVKKYVDREIIIRPLAVKMVKNGIWIAEFKPINTYKNVSPRIEIYKFDKIFFSPAIKSWS